MKRSKRSAELNKFEVIAKDLWIEASLKMWGYKCLVCDKEAIQFHHYVPKSRSVLLRYSVKNAIPLCRKCHYIVHKSHEPDKIHAPVETIRQKRGEEWCKWIDANKRGKARLNKEFIENEIEFLKEVLA